MSQLQAYVLVLGTILVAGFALMFGRRKGRKLRLTRLGMALSATIFGCVLLLLLYPSSSPPKPTASRSQPKMVLEEEIRVSQPESGDAKPIGKTPPSIAVAFAGCPNMPRNETADDFMQGALWNKRRAELEAKGIKDPDSLVERYRETGSFLPEGWVHEEEFEGRLTGEELYEKVWLENSNPPSSIFPPFANRALHVPCPRSDPGHNTVYAAASQEGRRPFGPHDFRRILQVSKVRSPPARGPLLQRETSHASTHRLPIHLAVRSGCCFCALADASPPEHADGRGWT